MPGVITWAPGAGILFQHLLVGQGWTLGLSALRGAGALLEAGRAGEGQPSFQLIPGTVAQGHSTIFCSRPGGS